MQNSQTPTYNTFKHTTSEIRWVGGDIPCLGICNGISLTKLETEIANKVCELLQTTDASKLILPKCLDVAWKKRDKTILEFIKFLLDNYCTQQQINASLQNEINNVNPQITLSYCCCNEDDGCNTSVTLTLSSHLQKILNCLCLQATRIDELENDLKNIEGRLSSLELWKNGKNNNGAASQISTLITYKTESTASINCIISKAQEGDGLTCDTL